MSAFAMFHGMIPVTPITFGYILTCNSTTKSLKTTVYASDSEEKKTFKIRGKRRKRKKEKRKKKKRRKKKEKGASRGGRGFTFTEQRLHSLHGLERTSNWPIIMNDGK